VAHISVCWSVRRDQALNLKMGPTNGRGRRRAGFLSGNLARSWQVKYNAALFTEEIYTKTIKSLINSRMNCFSLYIKCDITFFIIKTRFVLL
jgi:uncharacterized protein (UPF0254 family)